jgi:MFS family permease
MENESIQDDPKRFGFFKIIRHLWPNFLIFNSFAFTISALFINLLILSRIMWPGDALETHATELGALAGSFSYMMAISGILFGILADKFSRIKLMALSGLVYGIGLFINGFAPQGLGLTTFAYFLVFNLIRGFASGGFFPLINSYSYDSTEEKERSQFFGILQALFQLFQILGMLLSSILFQNLIWREFFWIIGLIVIFFGVMILLRAKEPKRGAKHKELKEILIDDTIKYEYKLKWATIKFTILRPTNLIAFFEGIFTTILIAVPDFLLIAYLQSEKHISAFATSILMVGFGLPGGVIGSLAFAKLSDKLGNKDIRNRLYMIVFSAVSIFIMFLLFFFIPIPVLTEAEGLNLTVIFSIPVIWLSGILLFFGRGVLGLWNINQPPIIQAINLPEAQGSITSANQFLETIGQGTGTILAGALLFIFSGNYQITASITMSLGIIGGLMWLVATIWVKKDVDRISAILKQRSIELSRKSNKNLIKG